MSHFTVLVIGDGDLSDRMHQFEEQTDDKELLEFKIECRKEDVEQYRIDIMEKYPDTQKTMWKIPIEEFMNQWGSYEFNERRAGMGLLV